MPGLNTIPIPDPWGSSSPADWKCRSWFLTLPIAKGFQEKFLGSHAVKNLSAKVELLDNCLVAAECVLFEVIQKFPATARHFEKTAAGMEVLAIGPQVLG
jgi:hypothetical protein